MHVAKTSSVYIFYLQYPDITKVQLQEYMLDAFPEEENRTPLLRE